MPICVLGSDQGVDLLVLTESRLAVVQTGHDVNLCWGGCCAEGQIPRGAQYLGEKVTVEGDTQHTDTFYAVPTEEKTTTTKTVEQKPLVYEGIGPVDKEGVPLAFRKVGSQLVSSLAGEVQRC